MHSILNHAFVSHVAQRSKVGLLTGISATLFLGAVAAFGTAPSTVVFPGRFQSVAEQLDISSIERIEAMSPLQVREVRIQPGDTINSLMARLGVTDEEVTAYLRTNPATDTIFRQVAPGKTLIARVSNNGRLESLAFPLNGNKDTLLWIEHHGSGYRSEQREIEFETRTTIQSATIRHSLFGAADDAGIPDAVAAYLADIFGGDIDFHRDLRKGDRFSVVYETVTHQGKPVRPQRILAAEFVNDGKVHQAFWYQSDGGNGGYYTLEGKSIRKAFLRSPLEFSRVTSGFSNARFHPVLQEIRAHRGIDYGAPTGTRVKATGDGIVDFVGLKGGYGKVIQIRHPGDKITLYGHLSGFASGIKQGQRVTQGEIIGFVGATGLASGPHLHYEFKVGGVHKNPLALILPSASPLPERQMRSFQVQANGLFNQLSLAKEMQLVRLD